MVKLGGFEAISVCESVGGGKEGRKVSETGFDFDFDELGRSSFNQDTLQRADTYVSSRLCRMARVRRRSAREEGGRESEGREEGRDGRTNQRSEPRPLLWDQKASWC